MKILSVAIPCYNSESYMEKCIKSLLPAGEDIEILVVNDGSKKMCIRDRSMPVQMLRDLDF